MMRTTTLYILLILLVACSFGQGLELTVCIDDTGETSLVTADHAHECGKCPDHITHASNLSGGATLSHADNHTHIPLQETLPLFKPPARIHDMQPETGAESNGASAIASRYLEAFQGITVTLAFPASMVPQNDPLISLIGTVISLS